MQKLEGLTLLIPLVALSVNNIEKTKVVGRSSYRYKLPIARKFKAQAQEHLKLFEPGIARWAGQFDQDRHAINVRYTFGFDPALLFTKEKRGIRRLSNRVGDVDNYCKYTTDVLFDVININDRFIHEITAKKVPALHPYIKADLSIVSLAEIPEYVDYCLVKTGCPTS